LGLLDKDGFIDMGTVREVYEFLCKIAPIEMKMDFDNVGLLVGRRDSTVTKILVSLDITNDVIAEASDFGAELIVSHHPLFFSLKSVTDDDLTGKKIIKLLSGGMSAICMHTNLDAARGGVNDMLATAAGIADYYNEAELLAEDGVLATGQAFSYGRVGYLKNPLSFSDYLRVLSKELPADGLRYYDAGRDVYKVAVVGGSGGDMLEHAIRHGCDTFVTADIKYNLFLEAKELGMNLIDGGHYCTENVVTGILSDKLAIEFPDTEILVSKRHGQVVQFYVG